MFDSSEIIVGLEVGTSKVCAVVGEVNPNGGLNIIGIGQSRSRGVRKGEIVDTAFAEEDIRNAIAEAEQKSDVEIRSVYLGVTGSHVQGFNNRGVHTVVSAEREISDEDVEDVVKNAKAINLPTGHHVIHAVRQHFWIDGQQGITNPIGMLGTRMEVDMHVVHGNLNRLQNPVRVVKSLQVDVDNVVFTGLSSALALLTNEQKELGALVIDMGGGTTEYVVYSEGIIKHTGLVTVGGDHVTNDLAIGLKLPLMRAEKIKLAYGNALLDESARGQTITQENEVTLPKKTISLEHIRCIMSLRLEELFELIATELRKVGLLDYLRAGVFLCGGGSRIPAIHQLAQNVFQLPVTPGKVSTISGLRSALDQPEFSTAIGLVKFGSMQKRKRPSGSGLVRRFRNTMDYIFRRG